MGCSPLQKSYSLQVIDASSRIFPDLCLCSTDVVEEHDGEEDRNAISIIQTPDAACSLFLLVFAQKQLVNQEKERNIRKNGRQRNVKILEERLFLQETPCRVCSGGSRGGGSSWSSGNGRVVVFVW